MTDQEQSAWIDRQLQAGLRVAYTNMLAFKRYKQTPVIVSRNGKILEVHPDDMPPIEQPAT